ncbi:hypothetical protein ACFL6S_13055, partial [Candidatus Poribacteria bacterium]
MMRDPRLSKDEKVAQVDTIQATSSEDTEEAPVDNPMGTTSRDPSDSIIFAPNASVSTFTISKVVKKPDEVAEEQEAEPAISLAELLQKARRLDKVSSKISCAEIMLGKGIVSQEDIEKILKEQGETKGYFHQVIADMNLAPREKVLEVAAEEWGVMRYIDLAEEESIDPEIIKMIPETKARRSLCIPVYKTETTLSVAMADPLDIFAADDIKISLRATGLEFEIEPLLAFPKDIEKKLEEVYGLGDTIVQEILEGIQEHDDIQVEATADDEEDEDLDIARSMELAQKGPIIGLVNAILVEAVKQGASDIHIEPFRKKSLLRFRI